MVFVPSGCIGATILNFTGSMHDSQISELSGLYYKLKKFYEECSWTIVVESAFEKRDLSVSCKSATDETQGNNGEEINLIRQST